MKRQLTRAAIFLCIPSILTLGACAIRVNVGGSEAHHAHHRTNHSTSKGSSGTGSSGTGKSNTGTSNGGGNSEQIKASVNHYLDPKNADYGAVMDPDARAAALRGMTKGLSDALTAKTSAEREAKALAVLKSRPELEASGAIAGLSVWGRFKDGRILVVPTYPIAQTQVKKAQPKFGARLDKPMEEKHSALAKDLPVPQTAAAIDAMRWDPAFSQQVVDAARNAGYEPRLITNADATVTGMQTAFQGEGFFYLHMHGGAGYERGKGNQPPVFGLQTQTPVVDCQGKVIDIFDDKPFAEKYGTISVREVAKCSDRAYSDELEKGRIIYAWAPGVFRTVPGKTEDVRVDGWYYAITGKFIDKYAHFGEHSWMYQSVCQSMTPEGKQMFEVMRSKGLRGAAGWTESVDPEAGSRAAELFMKRLLGAKEITRLVGADTPPGRPWDVEKTWEELVRHKWNTGEVDGKIAYSVFEGDNVLLRPSISYMEVDEKAKELTIHGEFGTKTGRVTVGGKECPVKQGEWSETKIVCELGDDGKAGNVVVEVNKRKSNEAPLTLWEMHLEWTLDWPKDVPGGFRGGYAFDLRFRGDVHGYRELPDQAPKDNEPFYMLPAPGSTCMPRSEGDLSKPFAHFGAMSGSEVVPIKNEPPTGPSFCRAYAYIDPKAKTMKLALLASKRSGSYTDDHKGNPGTGLLPTPKIFSTPLPPPPNLHFPPQQAIVLALDDHFAPKTEPMTDSVNLGPKKADITLKIGGNATQFFPTLDTAR